MALPTWGSGEQSLKSCLMQSYNNPAGLEGKARSSDKGRQNRRVAERKNLELPLKEVYRIGIPQQLQ